MTESAERPAERPAEQSAEHREDATYKSKAMELAHDHWEEQQRRVGEERRAIRKRDPFYGLQIVPTATFYDEASGRAPGDRNWQGYGFDLHPQVTFLSAGLVILFIIGTLLLGEQAEVLFSSLVDGIGNAFGWLYLLAANFFILVMVLMASSKYGNIRIGGPNALPEFNRFSWFAMLISAGMGIGLLFWSVAEPISHMGEPSPMFDVSPGSPQAIQAAMGLTYFHWGLHPWGIYALVSLSLAFFAYNRGLPLTIRSIFYPLLGERIYGFWGNVIDILSVLATLFGLTTSLGLGVQQVSAGLTALFGLPAETWFSVVLIAVITGFATLSVVAGLDKGVKHLSSLNIYLAAGFLVFLLLVGPQFYIFRVFTQNLGYYLQNLLQLSFWVETFQGQSQGQGAEGSNWQNTWTIFYWGWWISWSPFVGMFIARVSKGRTVREFIIGVMVVPTLLSFLWISTLGGAALWLQTTGAVDIAQSVTEDVSTALFAMLEGFPLTSLTSLIGIVLVTVLFVTSSDSGSLVVDHLTSGGKLDAPVLQRIFWAVMEGVCAAVLLIGGGLTALQSASIATGLPFTFVLLVMCYSLYRGIREEHYYAEIIDMIQPKTRRFEIPSSLLQKIRAEKKKRTAQGGGGDGRGQNPSP
jgi:choline/glycine/proline betaine transport protein